MTIGDVLAIIALVMLVTSSWGALIVFWTYIAPAKIAESRQRLNASFGWCATRGALLFFATLIFVAITAGKTVGAFRLIPFAIAGALFLASSIGSAAIVQQLAERMDSVGKPQDCPDIVRTVRATAVYCLAGLFPVGGWFIVAPLALFATVGSMFGSLPGRKAINIPSQRIDISQPDSGVVVGG